MESSPADLQLVSFYHRPNEKEKQDVGDAPSAWGVMCILGRPQSRGSIRLRDADPLTKPIIAPNYLHRDVDRQALVQGLKLIRRIANQKALQRLLGNEISPGRDAKSDEELSAYVTQNLSTTWHPVGTCKMGNDSMSVVDPKLSVHEVDGLYVADASIMPRIPNANTNAPCIMIGEKFADTLLV